MWIRARPGGLLVPVDLPRLTIGAAIGRGWYRHGGLLLPPPEKYLRTWPAYPFARLPKTF